MIYNVISVLIFINFKQTFIEISVAVHNLEAFDWFKKLIKSSKQLDGS